MIYSLLRYAVFFSLASSSYAEVYLAETAHPVHTFINPKITPLPLPTTPHNMPVAEFGLQVMGWGIGAESAQHRWQSLNSEDVDKIK